MKRQQGTKERLLDAAECLFAEHGYTGTSLRMISQQASVNIASANYFLAARKGFGRRS